MCVYVYLSLEQISTSSYLCKPGSKDNSHNSSAWNHKYDRWNEAQRVQNCHWAHREYSDSFLFMLRKIGVGDGCSLEEQTGQSKLRVLALLNIIIIQPSHKVWECPSELQEEWQRIFFCHIEPAIEAVSSSCTSHVPLCTLQWDLLMQIRAVQVINIGNQFWFWLATITKAT